MQQTFRTEQSNVLGYNALSTGNDRRFGEIWLHLQIGQQLQYLPVFTEFYPTRLESLTPHLFINRRFKISNHQ